MTFLDAAAALALVTFLVHWLVGGRHASRPLLAAPGLPEASRWLNYFCWHIVTIHLLVMAAALACVAQGLLDADVARLVAIMAAAIALLSLAVTLRAGIRPWRLPASYLLAGVATLSWLGARGQA